jgi:hypothetical protein
MKVNSKQLRQRTLHATKVAAAKRSKTKKHRYLFETLKSDHSINRVINSNMIATTAFVTSHLGKTK